MLRLKESTSKAGYLRLAMDSNAAAAGAESVEVPSTSTAAAPPPAFLHPSSSSEPARAESERHLSKSPLARVMLESERPKMEFKPTPRRRNGKAAESEGRSGNATCEQHSFLTDVTDVRQMEQGLLQLLHDFHSGKLQAFGKDCTFEKMEHVREQQERLARLHFELNAQQEHCGPESEEGRQLAKDNLTKLIENLQHLSQSIEQLQSHTQGV
ncbi:uncharacterized protein LOC119174078 isoform X3 [Rhipicephalus microplus]|uniref:uncharacterized protein LOC119174078 isoform X3 n=1 Tax=Rhipicephalus microplus TaxID=6941 RepID=UPI001887697F|nr:coiled-coil domain-containing protein 28B-like isoform X1 [Rhipicephalus microplus]